MGERGLAMKAPTPTPRRRRLQHSCDPIGLGLEHMAHLLGPILRLVTRAKNRVGELLDVPAGLRESDDPSPLQTSPGTTGVHHFFEDLVVRGPGVMALIADRDQTQKLALSLAQHRLEQTTELISKRALTGFGHLPQGSRPHPLAPAGEHGDGGGGPLLCHAPAQRHQDAVAPNRQRRPQAPRGGTGLLDPAQHLFALGAFSLGGHPCTQLSQYLAQGGACPRHAMGSLDNLQHLVWGVVGGPGAYAFSESRCGQARFDPQTQLQGMHGVAAVPTRFVEAAPQSDGPKERAHDMRMFAAAARETALEQPPGRRLAVGIGLEAVEGPCHDPSSNLAKQGAALAFKGHGGFGCRLGVDKPVKEPGAPGEQARTLHDEGRKGRCQQGLGWRRMDHQGAPSWCEGVRFHPFTKGTPSQQPPFPIAFLAAGKSAITPLKSTAYRLRWVWTTPPTWRWRFNCTWLST